MHPLPRRAFLARLPASLGGATVALSRFLPNAPASIGGSIAAATAGCLSGCSGAGNASDDTPERVWGRSGFSNGRFQKPRAIAIDRNDCLYIVDLTARIQVFDIDGNYLRGWKTPESDLGRPTGMSIIDDELFVADTHYYRVLVYDLQGNLKRQFSGGSNANERFGLVTDIARSPAGTYYVSEYGDVDRIHAIAPDGSYLGHFGKTGQNEAEFVRPQAIAFSSDGTLWVADACNHRLQQFQIDGSRAKLLRIVGNQGDAAGQFHYPYGLTIAPDNSILVCEWGNQRVQRLDANGSPRATWGRPGRQPGQLNQPWSLALDRQSRITVLDSLSHRVQRFRFADWG
jgi:sugar lactone lactonase YvrE